MHDHECHNWIQGRIFVWFFAQATGLGSRLLVRNLYIVKGRYFIAQLPQVVEDTDFGHVSQLETAVILPGQMRRHKGA
jgi:hypothetical protein